MNERSRTSRLAQRATTILFRFRGGFSRARRRTLTFGRDIPTTPLPFASTIILNMIFKTIVFLALGACASAQSVNDPLLQEIKVTSGRNYAIAGFNTPAVRVWLPRLPNSAYATQTFAKPNLVDVKGQPMEYKLERGIYDHDKWEDEIRIESKGEPARVIGTIHVRYPVRIREAGNDESKEKLTEPATFVKLPMVFVEEWKEIEISYDLPIQPKLPNAEIGNGQPLPKVITDTPGGKVKVTIKQ